MKASNHSNSSPPSQSALGDTDRRLRQPALQSTALRPTSLGRPATRLARGLVRWRWVLLLIGIATLPPLAWISSQLRMDRSIASMFSPSDPVLIDYQNLRSAFHGNLVVMLVYDDQELMSPAGLKRSRQWSEQAEQIAGVEGVLSVAKLVDAFVYLRPPLPFSSDSSIALFDSSDELATEFRGLFASYTHSPDERTAAIVVMLQPSQMEHAIEELRRLAKELPKESNPVLVGEPVLLQDAFDLIESDGRRLAIGTITLLSLVLLITLRDRRIVTLAALCIAWATTATRATMVLAGIELSLVSTILLAIVSVIVIAGLMHLGIRSALVLSTRSRASILRGRDTLAMLAIPIGWTCLTDAAGFASLTVSQVQPVVDFGIMTAAAALFVMIAFALFSPALISVPRDFQSTAPNDDFDLPPVDSAPSRPRQSQHRTAIQRIAHISIRHRFLVTIISLAVMLIASLEVAALKTNSSFLGNFRPQSKIVQSYQRVETRLGGAGVWDVVLPAPTIMTPTYLDSVRELEGRLREIRVTDPRSNRVAQLTKVLSLADADQTASKSPLLSFAPPEVRLAGMRAAIPTFAEALLNFPSTENVQPHPQTTRKLRIILRSEEQLPGELKQALIEQVTREVSTTTLEGLDKTSKQHPAVTGYTVLISRLVGSLVRDQWTAFTVALLTVGSLIWIATGRLSHSLAALLANTLPILAVLAAVGAFGGSLDLGSAMIGAVSIGLSIDGSIHFLAGYQRLRHQGDSPEQSAFQAATDLGAPILLATIALVIGFAVLITSPFVPTSTFGLLVAATLAASAVVNMFLLPAMIVLIDEHLNSPTHDTPNVS